jgi:hypothetical protein
MIEMPPPKPTKRVRDWNAFVRQPDPKVTTDKVGSTKERIRGIHLNFQKYYTITHLLCML